LGLFSDRLHQVLRSCYSIVETRRKIINVVGNCQSCPRGGWRFKMLSFGKFLVCRKNILIGRKSTALAPPPPKKNMGPTAPLSPSLGYLFYNNWDTTFLTLFILTHPASLPCGRKPEHPEKTHDFQFGRALTYSFHISRIARIEHTISEVEGACSITTASPKPKQKPHACILDPLAQTRKFWNLPIFYDNVTCSIQN
jgi:hypothetical protein